MTWWNGSRASAHRPEQPAGVCQVRPLARGRRLRDLPLPHAARRASPGYYFWRDRRSGAITRRSEWFITKSPTVERRMHNRSNTSSRSACRGSAIKRSPRSRKHALYPGAEPWIAKLDTIVHELYHIDPTNAGIRRIVRADGTSRPTRTARSSSRTWRAMVTQLSRDRTRSRDVRLPRARLRRSARASTAA